MDRQPAPPTKRPRCWSISYSEDDDMCLACLVADDCAMASEDWDYIHSMSEMSAWHETDTKKLSVSELYAEKYEEHFGKRPYGAGTDQFEDRHRATFGKVEVLAASEDIDPAMWIDAQMIGLKKYLPAVGFQPNMLAGANAVKRYRIQVEMNQRFFHNSTADVNSSQTIKGKIIKDLTQGEFDVGEYYIAAHIVNDLVDWDTAIERAEPNDLWLSVRTDRKVKLKGKRYDKALLAKCGETAKLRAACQVVNTYHPEMADWIGFRDDFTWETLAELMRKLFDGVRKNRVSLEGVGGIQWS